MTRPKLEFTLGGKSILSRIISDEAFEQKIKQHAEEIVNKSHADLQAKMTQRTKQIREYVDG